MAKAQSIVSLDSFFCSLMFVTAEIYRSYKLLTFQAFICNCSLCLVSVFLRQYRKGVWLPSESICFKNRLWGGVKANKAVLRAYFYSLKNFPFISCNAGSMKLGGIFIGCDLI